MIVPTFARWARALALALACLSTPTLTLQAATIEGLQFDDRIRLGNGELVLNGLGLRAVAWFKGYAAGLYLPERATTAEQALALPGPKRIQMKLMVDVDAAEFVKAVEKGFRRNHDEAAQQALQPRQQQFVRNIERVPKLRKGDVINLDFVPATGLTLSVNGVVQGPPVPGADYFAGILKIYIGVRPVDKEMKAGLLGGKP